MTIHPTRTNLLLLTTGFALTVAEYLSLNLQGAPTATLAPGPTCAG